jgi:cell division protein FtsW (lipid II flippase)
MVNIITGLIAIVLIIAFLGNYAIKVGSIALSIIIVITLALVYYDFVQSLRNGEKES